MNKVEAIIRPERVDRVKDALAEAGFAGLNVVPVTGRGRQRGVVHVGRTGERASIDMLPKAKIEVVCRDADTQRVVDIIITNARTGNIGDGKVFVMPVANVYRVRTGEYGDTAL
ncbi:MAG: P-II family nitrogen regulator [Chloroflexi bacterium]|nr:P-II family nitrogen regulator [Chloroflexota bacterium]